MRLYYVTFMLPADVAAPEAAHIHQAVDSLLHALRPPPQSAGAGADTPLGGKLVQLSQQPVWLCEQLAAVSPELRLLVMPRDPTEVCVTYPAGLLPELQIDRANWEMTCVRFTQAAAKWQPPPSLWKKLTSWGKA